MTAAAPMLSVGPGKLILPEKLTAWLRCFVRVNLVVTLVEFNPILATDQLQLLQRFRKMIGWLPGATAPGMLVVGVVAHPDALTTVSALECVDAIVPLEGHEASREFLRTMLLHSAVNEEHERQATHVYMGLNPHVPGFNVIQGEREKGFYILKP